MSQAVDTLVAKLNESISDGSSEELLAIGAALHQAARPDVALRAFEAACERDPQRIEGWLATATLRLELQCLEAALDACRRALTLAPDDPQCLYCSGVVFSRLGDASEALRHYDQVLAVEPQHYGALRNRPMMLLALGRGDEAQHAARVAVEAFPHDAWLHFNLADLLLGMHALAAAEAAYRRALELSRDMHRARFGLSIALAAQGRVREAYGERRAAMTAEPALLETYKSPLVVDELSGTNDTSPERVAILAAFADVRRCDWQGYDAYVRLYGELVEGAHDNPPLSQFEMTYLALGLPISEHLRRQVARQVSAQVMQEVAGKQIRRSKHATPRKLRIGYLSADYRPHPMAFLMGDIYARHDRRRFMVFAYSVGPEGDNPQRDRVRAGADIFRNLHGRTVESAAQRIADDAIDILVDPCGFMLNMRQDILALKPAPIQVSYIGMPGTYGAPYIDYTMLDRHILTPETRAFWDEKIAYLPDCAYHCEMPDITETRTREQEGLPPDAFVFGALHHTRKLDPGSFAVWMQLLHEIPHSVLWLVCETNEQIENLKRNAASHGIASERLVFARFVPHDLHLARFALADVFLDLFEYNGHTTTVEALTAGIPVITLRGETAVTRVAASMLAAHGLPELIADSVDEYKSLVHRFAADAEWRADICRRTRDYASSRLFRPQYRVCEIEAAFETMWARYAAGLPPEDFDVAPADEKAESAP